MYTKTFSKLSPFLFIILLLGVFSFVFVNKIDAALQCTAIASGNWTNPAVWSNCNGVDGIPADTDSVSISTDSTVTLDTNVTVNYFSFYDPVDAVRELDIVSPGSLTTTNGFGFGAGASGAGSVILDIGDGTTVTIGGDLQDSGTLIMSGTSTINFNGNIAQAMGAYTTYNNVVIENTDGGVTISGGVTIQGDLDINEGVLNTGEYTLTVMGDTTVADGGTLNLGSDLFSLATLDATAEGSTVNYTKAGAQTVINTTYHDLGLQGSGAKSFSGNLVIDNILSIDSGVVAELVLTSSTTNGLYFDGALQAAGTWGATGSGADFENDTYFSGAGGIITNAGTATLSVFEDGDGTEEDPYIIASCAQLMEVNNFLDAYFELDQDLDCTANGNDIMIGSDPIADEVFDNPFTGNFNGNGYTVTVGIDTGDFYAGLFRYVDDATINNLGVAGTVTGSSYVGGIAGYANNSDVDGVFSTATVTGDSEYIGGAFGYIYGGIVTYSYATGTVEGGTENIGGFVGEVDGEAGVVYCYATGAVATANDGIDIGGFAGDIDNSEVLYSYATGDVSGLGYVGGFVGDADTNTSISYSYATGQVEGTEEKTGGFIGDAVDGVSISDSYTLGLVTGVDEVGGFAGNIEDSTLTHVYSAGSSVMGDTRVGGLVGDDDGGNTFTMDFFDTETSGLENACGEGDCINVVGETTENMKNVYTFNPYSEDEYGFPLDETATYRYIKWEIIKIRDGSDTDCYTGDVCTQASEFLPTINSFSSLTFITDAVTTNPGGINPGGSEAGYLFDGNTGTKFLDAAFSSSNNSEGSTIVIFDVEDGNEVEFNGYNWATGDDMITRDPVSWVVSGSEDGIEYTILDTVTDYSPTTDRSTFVGIENENWDFYNVWGIDEEEINNVGYPFFQWQAFDYEYSEPVAPYVITEVTPIPTTTTDRSPIYHFAIDGEGEAELLVSESCGEDISATALGSDPDDQEVQFGSLEVGVTYECSIRVNSDAGLSNILEIGPFTIIASGGNSSSRITPHGLELRASRLLASQISTTTTIPSLTRLLKFKMTGEDVKMLQQLLNKKGFILAPFGAGAPGSETTLFGMRTLTQTKAFQKANGLILDGIVGPLTWGMLTK